MCENSQSKTWKCNHRGLVVEHWSRNCRVLGSNPALAKIKKELLSGNSSGMRGRELEEGKQRRPDTTFVTKSVALHHLELSISTGMSFLWYPVQHHHTSLQPFQERRRSPNSIFPKSAIEPTKHKRGVNQESINFVQVCVWFGQIFIVH